MYCIEESTCDIVETFRRPHIDSAPGNLCTPFLPSLRPGVHIHNISEDKENLCRNPGSCSQPSAIVDATGATVFDSGAVKNWVMGRDVVLTKEVWERTPKNKQF